MPGDALDLSTSSLPRRTRARKRNPTQQNLGEQNKIIPRSPAHTRSHPARKQEAAFKIGGGGGSKRRRAGGKSPYVFSVFFTFTRGPRVPPPSLRPLMAAVRKSPPFCLRYRAVECARRFRSCLCCPRKLATLPVLPWLWPWPTPPATSKTCVVRVVAGADDADPRPRLQHDRCR